LNERVAVVQIAFVNGELKDIAVPEVFVGVMAEKLARAFVRRNYVLGNDIGNRTELRVCPVKGDESGIRCSSFIHQEPRRGASL
jgi:hypothetical protein